MKTVDLTSGSMKILGMHFSYNKELKLERNFIGTVKKIEKLLGIWRQRSLTLEGKIVIFKTLAISKIVYILFIRNAQYYNRKFGKITKLLFMEWKESENQS